MVTPTVKGVGVLLAVLAVMGGGATYVATRPASSRNGGEQILDDRPDWSFQLKNSTDMPLYFFSYRGPGWQTQNTNPKAGSIFRMGTTTTIFARQPSAGTSDNTISLHGSDILHIGQASSGDFEITCECVHLSVNTLTTADNVVVATLTSD